MGSVRERGAFFIVGAARRRPPPSHPAPHFFKRGLATPSSRHLLPHTDRHTHYLHLSPPPSSLSMAVARLPAPAERAALTIFREFDANGDGRLDKVREEIGIKA